MVDAMPEKKGILERLRLGPVIGDGGFLIALEKRGYVTGGEWVAVASLENPEAVRQLHREFLRAGSDVMQTFTYFCTEDKLEMKKQKGGQVHSVNDVNQAACDIARQVADEGGALVAGGVTHTPTYEKGGTREEVQKQFKKQIEVFVKNKTDFIICEYFAHVEEIEYAIEVAVTSGQPVAASMCIGPNGDLHGVSPEECALRMTKAGASIVGLNCRFDFNSCLKTISMMKDALTAAGLTPYLMVQPHGFHTPDSENYREGYVRLPQFALALDPRTVTRCDMHKFAREAWRLGVRYIGGCCGTESYHIRAMAEELSAERGGRMPLASDKSPPWGAAMAQSMFSEIRLKVGREYWEKVESTSGRPYTAPLSRCD